MDGADGAGKDRSKLSDLKEQILQLAGLACHEEEKSWTELLEKLRILNKYMLVELCHSFDIPGSTSTKKDELVAIVMEFLMEYCSGIDQTNPDKKFKKRRRKRDLSGGKPLKKKKPDGTALETHGEEKADGSKGEEDRTNYSEFDLKFNRNECDDNKKGQFPKEEANPEPSERVNGSMSENLDGVALTEVPIPTNEQILATTPSAKLVSNVEGNNTNMKVSRNKNISITKKRVTAKTDRKDKSCGKQMSRGDATPRKQTVKPSRDELRQAVFIILDIADFATMTFGEVVKEVEKYFGKDLFERKPLIMSLIEEELFRLAEEAEKKELEEEEAAESKARAEQAAKERAKDGRVESDIDKANELEAGQDGKSKDAARNENGNSIEKGVKGGISVKAVENRNSDAAAESSQDGKAEDDVNEKNSDEFTMDVKAEKVLQNAFGDDGVEASRDGKAETVKENDNGDTVEGSECGKTEEASDVENDDTEDGRTEECRSGNGGNNAEDVNDREAEEPNSNENGGHVECAEDGKAQEAGNNEDGENTVTHGAKCGKAKEALENVNTEQILTDAGEDEDAEHSANTKVDVDSSKDGTAENGKTNDDPKTNSGGVA